MWTWLLNSALGATAAHRVPERVADGTCTQVWAWVTNKCRKKMNQGEGYIISEISQTKGEKREAFGKREELGTHILGRGVLSPWDVGPSDSVFLAPIWSSPIPKIAVAPSKPNFWTHSLQIHCNGFAKPRSRPLLGPVRKSWPYNLFIFLINYDVIMVQLWFDLDLISKILILPFYSLLSGLGLKITIRWILQRNLLTKKKKKRRRRRRRKECKIFFFVKIITFLLFLWVKLRREKGEAVLM